MNELGQIASLKKRTCETVKTVLKANPAHIRASSKNGSDNSCRLLTLHANSTIVCRVSHGHSAVGAGAAG